MPISIKFNVIPKLRSTTRYRPFLSSISLTIERAPPIRNSLHANPSSVLYCALFCRIVLNKFCKDFVEFVL